jgi:streptogramin lyase
MFKKTLKFVLVGCLLAPAAVFSQSASDIRVPSGFRVEKVLESNNATDPQHIAVLPSGDLLVALMNWEIDKITPTGQVSTFAKVKHVRDSTPFDIIATPAGKVYFSAPDIWTDPGLFRVDNGQPVRVTPPGWQLWDLTQDDSGNFYANANKPGEFQGIVKITDAGGNGQFAVTGFLQMPDCAGLAYRNGYVYVLQTGDTDRSGIIRRFNLNGGDGSIIASNLNWPSDLDIDSVGNFYTVEYIEDRPEGLGIWSYYNVIKIRPGNFKEIVHHNFLSGYLAVGPDDTLYISDFNRGCIFKVVNGVETLLTKDTGLNSNSDIAFDLDNRGYFSSFRYAQLKRFNPDTGAVDNVTDPLGSANQTLAVESDGKIYLSSYWPNAVYRFNPATSAVEKLASLWTRTFRFDSFGRLALTKSTIQGGTTYDDWTSTIGLLDLNSQQVTSYITGIRNIERGFLFDKDQNLFVKINCGDGIIKVPIPKDPTDPPFNVQGQPLFYDLRAKNSEIRFFAMNSQGQLLIPLSDTGDVVLGETNGSWHDFASGFHWPGFVSFDRNGVMYVVDNANGVFRIIGQDFMVPTVSERLTGLCQDIRAKVSNNGVANSFCTKIENAISSLTRGSITAGMNQIEAFINDVSAQRGKKIAVNDADAFIKLARQILDGLKLL